MKKMSDKTFYILIIILFLTLNLLNTLVVTLSFFNPGMNLYKRTFTSAFNAFLGNLGVLFAILGLTLLLFRNKRIVVLLLTIFTGLLSTAIFLLKIYSFYYSTAFSFFNARTFTNRAPILGKQLRAFVVKNLFKMGQYVAFFPFVILFVFVVVMFFSRKLRRKNTTHINLKPKLKFSLLILGFSLIFISSVRFENRIKASSPTQEIEALKGVQSMGVYNYYLKDWIEFITSETAKVDLSMELKENAVSFLNDHKNKTPINYLGDITSNTAPIFKDKNLVVIQMESFNNYLINLEITDSMGEVYEITPFINSLANNSDNLYYKRFYSNIGVGKTSDAEFAFNTGLYPDGRIVSFYDYIHEDYETLPKLFNEKGYNSSILTGSTKEFYRRHEVYPIFGFNPLQYYNQEKLAEENLFDLEGFYQTPYGNTINHSINGWINDYIVFDKTIDILNSGNKEYIFAQSTVLHTPFEDHEDITGFLPFSGVISGQMGRYLEYAYFFDQALKHFFNMLEINNLLDDTVIMLYGDHKSDLFIDEHRKLDMFSQMDTLYYHEVIHNVPLIVVANNTDLSNYQASTDLIRGQSDLKRTIANLFDLDPTYYFGVDVLTTDKTVTYVPLTLDFFTDDFHINIREELADVEMDETELNRFIYNFFKLKENYDVLIKYNFFTDHDDS